MRKRPILSTIPSFSKKQQVFARSKLKLTAMIGKEKAWGPAEIGKRQKRLAELAVQTWPREP